MNVTLVDEQGIELTEITSQFGPASGTMAVDWATRPDALFRYYFDRGSRTVTALIGAAEWSAVLGTRWQMGARRWFLDEFVPVRAPDYLCEQTGVALAPGFGAGGDQYSGALGATADTGAAAAAREQRGIRT